MEPAQVQTLANSTGQDSKRIKKHKRRRRHVPQRTCVGCRTVHAKREMMRIVRTPDGVIELDLSGKKAGRGAYLCREKSCWEKALKRRSLDHALNVTVDDATQAALLTFITEMGVGTEASA